LFIFKSLHVEALTSRGDLKEKLEYAVKLYSHNDQRDYLEVDEVKGIIYGILEILTNDPEVNVHRTHLAEITKECFNNIKLTQVIKKGNLN
jgi:hypothetical protein